MKKQLCRGDIIFDVSHAIVIVKWTKTLQSCHRGTFVLIPRLPSSPLCPVIALQAMFTQYPVHKNAPLSVPNLGVITQHQVGQHLAKILALLQLDPKMYTFHTFRRSGATLAFNNDVIYRLLNDMELGPVTLYIDTSYLIQLMQQWCQMHSKNCFPRDYYTTLTAWGFGG